MTDAAAVLPRLAGTRACVRLTAPTGESTW